MSERLLSEGFEHAAYALRNSIHNFRGPNVEPFAQVVRDFERQVDRFRDVVPDLADNPGRTFFQSDSSLLSGEGGKDPIATRRVVEMAQGEFQRLPPHNPAIQTDCRTLATDRSGGKTDKRVRFEAVACLEAADRPKETPKPEPEAVLAHLAMPCGFVPVSGNALVGCLSKSGKGWVLTYLGHHF